MIRPIPTGLPIQRPETSARESAPPVRPPETAQAETSLTADEARMIADVFPERPAMTLRLYGPGGTGSLQPNAVGGRIDLRG